MNGKVVLLTVLVLATAYCYILDQGVVEAYNPYNLHQALPVSTGDHIIQPQVTSHDWAI